MTLPAVVRRRTRAAVLAVRRCGPARAVRSSRVWGLLRDVVDRSLADRVPGRAAETAFFVVLGIFPALLVAAGLLGVLDLLVGPDLASGVRQQVVDWLRTVLTDRATPAVTSVANLFESRRGRLLTVSTVGALVTLSGAFAVLIGALNDAHRTTESRSWLHRRLLGLAAGTVTVCAVAVALAALVVGPLLGQGRDLAELAGLGAAFVVAWTVLRIPVLAAGLVLWVATLYFVALNRAVRWRSGLPGAVLTTALWLLASLGLHLYVDAVAGANPVLGAFGGGVIVMMWVYLLSVALLLGGELNAALRDGDRHRQAPVRPRRP